MPMAIGSVPTIAAMVVIMIGRKRSKQASRIAARAATLPPLPPFDCEVDHHDGVLLDDAHQHDDADDADNVQIMTERQQRQQRADPRRGRPDRMVSGCTKLS